MTNFEIAQTLVEAFGVDPDDAHKAIEMVQEADVVVTPFTLYSRLEWEPDVCERALHHIHERLG